MTQMTNNHYWNFSILLLAPPLSSRFRPGIVESAPNDAGRRQLPDWSCDHSPVLLCVTLTSHHQASVWHFCKILKHMYLQCNEIDVILFVLDVP